MIEGDENIKQSFPCSCAIKCQQLILLNYGINVAEKDLCKLAENEGWYNEAEGMLMRNNGMLLGCFSIGYHHLQHNTLNDIAKEIAAGHRVMVNVNPDKLHIAPTETFRYNHASHCVLVNQLDCEKGTVYLTDTMTGNIDEPCPCEWFMNAWRDSLFYMLATDSPVKYYYDTSTKTMKQILTKKL